MTVGIEMGSATSGEAARIDLDEEVDGVFDEEAEAFLALAEGGFALAAGGA